MTVNEKGLEPCPFCGGPAELDNAAEPQFARRPTVTCANEDCFGYMPSAYFATDKEAIAAWNRRASIVGAEPVLANVLGDENDLHSVSHALDIGGIGTPYRAYQGSLYCDYQPHRIADFQDYGLALAASVLFNSAKAIKAALAHPAPSAGEGGVKGLAGAEYEAIHRRAIEAYEAATPPDYRYSATALRKAVDAARAEEARILTAIEPVAASPGVGLTISRLQAAHIERQEEWCPDQKPDLSFRGNELGGEAGEAQNVIKKLERERLGWRGSRDTVEHLAEELADVVHTATLCAITAGIDLEPAVLKKFNDTSEKNGLTSRLTAAPTSPAPSPAGGDVLKRYAWVKLTGSVTLLPVVRDDGEWVKFSDVADLCAANQKLRALSSKQRSDKE